MSASRTLRRPRTYRRPDGAVTAWWRAFRHGSAARLESVAALAACLAASVAANARLLRADVVSDDALVHQFWMRHWQDPALFNDPLTTELRRSVRYPDGYQALFWLTTHAFDPIAFGEWLGVGLMALSGWLVFRIVREQEMWRPAAWIGAALFLSLLEIHRFAGGFPRAFVQPVVLLTVLLAMRGRDASAATVAGTGALFYPPAGALAVGVLAVSSVRRWRIDVRRAAFAGLAAAGLLAAVLAPRLLAGDAPRMMSAAEARAFPEFGAHGTLPFFVDSLTRYLSQNRSGFDLRVAGSILVVAGLALLVLRWRDVPRLAPEVLAIPVASLGAFALAQLVLFQLYLPHRYTYPLVAFFAIAVAVLLRPLCEAGARHRASVLARPAAVAIGVLLLALILGLANGPARGARCPQWRVIGYLQSLPKDAVIAGDPRDLKCVPVSAERAVVTSTKLAPSYEAAAFRDGRARMFADLRAVYGSSPAAIAALSTRYGATHLWIRRNAVRRGARWRRQHQLPYGRYVHALLGEGEPASLRLPAACRRWRHGPVEVYDLACTFQPHQGLDSSSPERRGSPDAPPPAGRVGRGSPRLPSGRRLGDHDRHARGQRHHHRRR